MFSMLTFDTHNRTCNCLKDFWGTPYQLNQSAITCSKLPIETLKQGVKYVQS